MFARIINKEKEDKWKMANRCNIVPCFSATISIICYCYYTTNPADRELNSNLPAAVIAFQFPITEKRVVAAVATRYVVIYH